MSNKDAEKEEMKDETHEVEDTEQDEEHCEEGERDDARQPSVTQRVSDTLQKLHKLDHLYPPWNVSVRNT